MTKERSNLSLHKSIFHKSFQVKQDEDISLVDSALDLEKHEFPIENKEDIILFDIDEQEIVRKFKNVEEISLSEYQVESLCIKGVYLFSASSFKIPGTTICLDIQGGDYMPVLMSKGKDSSDLWMKIVYELQCSRFITSINQRVESESKIRLLYNNDLRNLKIETPVSDLIRTISKSNITTLDLGWIYLTDNNLIDLSNCKKLKSLGLSYIYNDNFFVFPQNLESLTIYGSFIEKLSQINLENLEIEELYLEGNSINDLSDMIRLPSSIETLDLSHNLIHFFDIKDLPASLEYLFLDKNRIENSLFEGVNKRVVNTTVKYLSLHNNLLTVNSWLLNRISETFPMLEFLELSANITEGVPESLLVNDEENSCIDNVKFYLETQDYNHKIIFEEIKHQINYYNDNHKIRIKWKHESLPVKVILSDIQYVFNNYLQKMPLILLSDGLYCDITHNEISMLIRAKYEEENSITFDLHANNCITFNSYFYKYFEEINRLICLNTHHYILPTTKFSDGCDVFNLFYKRVFKFDKEIRGNSVILPNDGSPLVLIRNLKKDYLDKFEEKRERFYKEIKNIAFIIITGKNAFPFTLNHDFTVGNIEEKNNKYKETEYYDMSLRTAEEKQIYTDCISNEYLGEYCFQEGVIFADNDSTQKIKIYYNPVYFYINEDDITCLNPQITLSNLNLGSPKVGSRKLNLKLVDNKIILKYGGNSK